MAADRATSVLLTADTVGGVWTYAIELARELVRRGTHVHLATMGAPLDAQQHAQVRAIDGLDLHESAWRLEWMPSPWDDVDRAGEWLLGLEARLAPDLVHLNQFAFGALPFRAPTLLVAHSCVLSWWRAVHREAAPAEWSTYRERVARGLDGAGLVAAPTVDMLRCVRREYGFRGAGRVLPNGRDARLFAPRPKQRLILAAGRLWDDAKNLAALDAVASALDWPVHVAGSCRGPSGELQHPRHARALGQLGADAMARAMGDAAIYALPARYEPFGLSVLEAALSGCALVLGDIASLRETWGDAALFVPPDDHAALRSTLQRVIGDDGLRERLALAARQRALSFDPQRMADATVAAYAALQPAFTPREPVCA